jgi:hypothetical protein
MFGFLFWKAAKAVPKMSLAGQLNNNIRCCDRGCGGQEGSSILTSILCQGPDYEDTPSPDTERVLGGRADRGVHGGPEGGDWHESSSGLGRNIEVQQNWLARLFRVKPATSHLCFGISRKRARQEVAGVLREWRRYGMRDVQVDRERNIVFARVGKDNCKSRIRPQAFGLAGMSTSLLR